MEQKMVIPGRLPTLNEIISHSKQHWSVYKKEKETYTALVVAIIKKYKIKPVKSPVVVKILWVEKNKKRDKGNIRAGEKYISDGLVAAGILPGDGWAWVLGFEDTFLIDKANPRIEIIIEERAT